MTIIVSPSSNRNRVVWVDRANRRAALANIVGKHQRCNVALYIELQRSTFIRAVWMLQQ